VYFGVESTEAAIERVRELGGSALLEPVPVPAGSFAIARDPHGAVFAMFAGEFDP
jgi:uncharacterized protein